MANYVLHVALYVAFAVTTNYALAQSSVTIESQSASSPAPIPVIPVEAPQYPLDSLLASEEGNVAFVFGLDGLGRPMNVQLLSSSGFPGLDEQAMQTAKNKWQFRTGVLSAAPTAKASVNWTLPLEKVDKYALEYPPLPAGATAAKPISSHQINAYDYPSQAIRSGESGIVGLRYFVQVDGTVSKVEVAQSTGVKRLDDAAIKMITTRWNFEPAKQDSKPLGSWGAVTVGFQIDNNVQSKRGLRCYPQPIVAEETIAITGGIFDSRRGPPPALARVIDRWTFVTASGQVSDILMWTKSGLKRPKGSLLEQMKAAAYPAPSDKKGCWYYDPIGVLR